MARYKFYIVLYCMPNSFTVVGTLNSHVDSILSDTDSLPC